MVIFILVQVGVAAIIYTGKVSKELLIWFNDHNTVGKGFEVSESNISKERLRKV